MIEFLKWLWRDMDTGTKALLIISPALLLTFFLAYFYGPVVLLITAGIFMSLSVLIVVVRAVANVKGKWIEYKEHKEIEARIILSKLQGTQPVKIAKDGRTK